MKVLHIDSSPLAGNSVSRQLTGRDRPAGNRHNMSSPHRRSEMQEDHALPEIVYVTDPMCSWCFGFSPVIQQLYSRHKDQVRMTLRTGGLHVGNDYVVENDYREFLRGHWTDIGHRTGQKFSLGILDRGPWIYDTELACRALVAVRRLRPGAEWTYMPLIQAGFYTHNRDPHDPGSFALPAQEVGIGREEFLAAYHDPATRQETAADFAWARSMGINGFPTVVVHDARGWGLLTHGNRPLEELAEPLAGWIASAR
ncbi:MAG: DsbA family protein [Ramlibacter sp.]|nr:DsbA family protein [Ramlibacter sp.]